MVRPEPPHLRSQLARLLGEPVVGPMVPVGRGYTPAIRRIITLQSGRRAFVKCAANDDTARWLRDEQRIYDVLTAPFIAKRLAFEDGEQPVMVLEDLSHAHWPPTWRPGDVAAVRQTMAAVARCRVAGLPEVASFGYNDGWERVARDPGPLLSLGLVSAGWLDAALPALRQAAAAVDLSGDALLHSDLRSDNLCILPDRVVVVDWNFACTGSPLFDLAFWAPSLTAEGGGVPEDLLPHAPAFAAMVSGLFAARAGLPIIPHAPRVRHIQQVQLKTALPWAIRALRLPQP